VGNSNIRPVKNPPVSLGECVQRYSQSYRVFLIDSQAIAIRGNFGNAATLGPKMLRKLSEEVRSCLAHAEECERKAEVATSEKSRNDYLRLRQHWLTLANSHEFAERLLDFSKENNRRRAELYEYPRALGNLRGSR
jgi:hypothetical protein